VSLLSDADALVEPDMLRRALPELMARALDEFSHAVVGHHEVVELMFVAALARGHVLVEGPPGTAKTLLAQTMARVLGAKFQRVQFTPDTTPGELVGTITVRGGERVLEKGAVFTNVLLADEINRTPPKTQSALLEAMQERHVSVGGRTYWIDPPFFVMATQNPFEHDGVFPITESQLDRFLVKLHLDYGSEEEELQILDLPHRGVIPDMLGEVSALLGERGFLVAQEAVDAIPVPEEVARAVVRTVRHTREAPHVRLGGSPRATLHLLTAAKARALLQGRTEAEIDDVRALARWVLGHRIEADDVDGVIAEAVEHAC
jgi:MoxR-like ATPase